MPIDRSAITKVEQKVTKRGKTKPISSMQIFSHSVIFYYFLPIIYLSRGFFDAKRAEKLPFQRTVMIKESLDFVIESLFSSANRKLKGFHWLNIKVEIIADLYRAGISGKLRLKRHIKLLYLTAQPDYMACNWVYKQKCPFSKTDGSIGSNFACRFHWENGEIGSVLLIDVYCESYFLVICS